MGTPQSHGKKHPWFCHRQVFRQQIWMRHFGVKSQKATCLWSNSWHIQHLDNGPVPKALRDASQPLAKTYHDQGGVKRCTGKKGNSRNRSCLVQCSFKKIEDFFVGVVGIFWLVDLLFRFCSDAPDLRAYTKAFGYKIASILPNLSDGVMGLRFDKDFHSSGCCCFSSDVATNYINRQIIKKYIYI